MNWQTPHAWPIGGALAPPMGHRWCPGPTNGPLVGSVVGEAGHEQRREPVDDRVARYVGLVEPPVTGRLDHPGDSVRPDGRPHGRHRAERRLVGDPDRELLTEPA